MSKTTAKQRVDIIESYINLTPMIEIAARYGMSRQGVYKIIKVAGVDTGKNGGIEVSCYCCQKLIKRPRCQVRKAKHLFCNHACYSAWLQAGRSEGAYIYSRHGQRLARQIAAKYVKLKEGYVVHHINRNTLDNLPHNLMVFRGNGDHVRHHRGFEVEPVWDGSKL